MSLNEGQQIGRWQIVARLPSRDAVDRFRAVASDTGEPAEVLVLSRAADRGPAEFAEIHDLLGQIRDPALVRTLEVRDLDGRKLAVREPLESATLAEIKGPLDSPIVAAIGARLLPAVLAAGRATRGALRASDVGIDAKGQPSLAPIAEPLTRVALGSTRAVAPECFTAGDGRAPRAPDGAAGLYGLGVLLYTLAAGREPQSAGTRPDRAPPPPPSAVRHGIPPELDQAILRLLSSDPGARAGALPLLQEIAASSVDLRPLVRSAAPAEVRTGRALDLELPQGLGAPLRAGPTIVPPPPQPRTADIPGGMVLLPAEQLARLDPAARSMLAGLTRLPVAAIDALAESRLPVVLETSAGRTSARERASAIAQSTGLPAEYATNATMPPWIWLAFAASVASIPALLGAALLLTGLLPFAIAAFVVAGGTLAAGALAMRAADRPRALHRAGMSAIAKASAERASRDADSWLSPQWERLAALRMQIARSDLPAAAASDLRGSLREVEARLTRLAEAGQSADRTLRQVDLAGLRTKLAALQRRAEDPSVRAERDRLARTVADLEVVEATRSRLAEDAAAVDAILAEMAAALGQLAHGDDEQSLARLQRAARTASSPPASDPVASNGPTLVPRRAQPERAG